ncbi:hypothetical protein [Pseudalkalibacillus caeni]|uniref:Aldolase n=1 Tax=Exobacillus caeni TaxID=2574798 RepID=A0A5R9EZM2_9BACL|nr:hypothetical protein [Pseudalkalibacillus caeni]TLS35560.1 hypothetical protein FCL54_19570 [Pseudalkalibacillus caeni]
MERFQIKIADHVIKINGKRSELLGVLRDKYRAFLYDEVGDIDLFLNIEGGYGSPFTNNNVKIYSDNWKTMYQRADYLIEVEQDYKTAKISAHDELALKHALMNLYSSFILHYNWGLLIHSSCVIENGKAHIFAGNSGAGKSTAAKLSKPRDLLADEATIVKVDEDKISVYDSPFRSELESTKEEVPCQLGYIHLLNQSLTNERISLTKAQAIMELTDKVFYWCHTPEEAKRIFQLLTKLVETIPVDNLHFQKNNTFWELIS